MTSVVGVVALFILLAIGIVDLATDRDDATGSSGRRIGRPRLLVAGLVVCAVGLSPIGLGYEIVNAGVTFAFVMVCTAAYLALYFAALRPARPSKPAQAPADGRDG